MRTTIESDAAQREQYRAALKLRSARRALAADPDSVENVLALQYTEALGQQAKDRWTAANSDDEQAQ